MNDSHEKFFSLFQVVLYLFPLTYSLSCSSYYRYNELQSNRRMNESHWNRAIRIWSVYIIFGYTFLFVLFWSFVTTASYSLAWILSPFGITLALFSLVLYVMSQRLTLEDFRFPRINTQSEEILTINEEQLMNKDN